MSILLAAARDTTLGLFQTAWNANAPGLTPGGYTPQAFYDNQELPDPPNPTLVYVRVRMQHIMFEQATLGGFGNRRFRRHGAITMSIYVPKELGLALSDGLCQVARNAFEGVDSADGEIWYRDVTQKEIGNEGAFFRTDVSARFEFDEVK